MKSFPYLPLLALGCLSCFMPPSVMADDTAESINAMLKAGKEVAWTVAGAEDKDNGLAVLFTSRAKGSAPAAYPYFVTGDVRPGDTDALGGFDEVKQAAVDNRTMENIIVSLKEKRVLGRLKLGEDAAYFPGRNHDSLEAMWGPDEEGWHFGVLNFGAKWNSSEVLLVETDGDRIRQISIKPLLDTKASAFIKTALRGSKDFKADQYVIPYSLLSVVDPDSGYSVGNPVTVKIGFSAEVPKSDSAPEIDATMTVLLETSVEKISAKVLKVEKSAP